MLGPKSGVCSAMSTWAWLIPGRPGVRGGEESGIGEAPTQLFIRPCGICRACQVLCTSQGPGTEQERRTKVSCSCGAEHGRDEARSAGAGGGRE